MRNQGKVEIASLNSHYYKNHNCHKVLYVVNEKKKPPLTYSPKANGGNL